MPKKNFQQINEANEVLSDPEKRKKYDQYGKDWQHADEFEKAKQYRQQSSDSRGQRFSGTQILKGIFPIFLNPCLVALPGAGRSRQVKYRGEDYNAELHLDLIDAYKTHKQTLTVNRKKYGLQSLPELKTGKPLKYQDMEAPE